MKKALLSVFILTLVACGGDDPSEYTRTGTLDSRLAQPWQLTHVEYEAYMPNPINPAQGVNLTGEGVDTYGTFDYRPDGDADYFFGFTARIDIGTSEPLRLPFYRSGSGTWWTVGTDSVYVEDGIDTLKIEIIEDYDQKQRWQTVMPIFDTATGTFIPVDMLVILRR
ncbi:hypothetical protein [Phaeocystidibacter luteus]|uniref:Lipocalin family protein n=1 Tax=Phaeocystidibacter luteus TaxID=911197 RepID=A0A6N6RK21_9FLAO|nr:hypothetical protein [Phaeocystidibacter luteus]KAB2808641.1 hypothetical protein F8C67_10165 [Phaeocystidibacter luteus]